MAAIGVFATPRWNEESF